MIFKGMDLIGSVSDIVWARGTAVTPEVVASIQGPVHVQLLALGPKAGQTKGGQRVLSWRVVAEVALQQEGGRVGSNSPFPPSPIPLVPFFSFLMSFPLSSPPNRPQPLAAPSRYTEELEHPGSLPGKAPRKRRP